VASLDRLGGVAFRTTAGRAIGLGHLRRCLTLAEELTPRGVNSSFWLDGDAEAAELIATAGFSVDWISGDEPATSLGLVGRQQPSGVVVDSYTVDRSYFAALHVAVDSLIVIDDLADRDIEADVVVNGSANAGELLYRTNEDCVRLLGPRYSLLRPAFRGRPPRQLAPRVERVLITLGGSDPDGSMPRVVAEMSAALPQAMLDVVVGPLFTTRDQLEQLAQKGSGRITLHLAPANLFSLMDSSDLAISAGGQTLYELAACGVPTVAVCLADNQRGQLTALSTMGVLVNAGSVAADNLSRVGSEAARLATDRSLRAMMSAAGQQLVDGWGAERVAAAVVERVTRKTGGRHAAT
jgi:UDP-2,4-diacetamido-2,4,6-trideoxy-beta-L-altropyranose hydrolase